MTTGPGVITSERHRSRSPLYSQQIDGIQEVSPMRPLAGSMIYHTPPREVLSFYSDATPGGSGTLMFHYNERAYYHAFRDNSREMVVMANGSLCLRNDDGSLEQIAPPVSQQNGRISNIRIYNRQLSVDELRHVWNNTPNIPTPTHHWRLDEQGENVVDTGGNKMEDQSVVNDLGTLPIRELDQIMVIHDHIDLAILKKLAMNYDLNKKVSKKELKERWHIILAKSIAGKRRRARIDWVARGEEARLEIKLTPFLNGDTISYTYAFNISYWDIWDRKPRPNNNIKLTRKLHI